MLVYMMNNYYYVIFVYMLIASLYLKEVYATLCPDVW